MTIKVGDFWEVRAVIPCDDVREESNNKRSIMGVYSGDIVVPRFPAAFRITAYLEALVIKQVTRKLPIRVLLGEQKILEIEGQLDASQQGVMAMGLPHFLVSATEPSTLKIEVSADEGAWIELLSKKIIQGVVI